MEEEYDVVVGTGKIEISYWKLEICLENVLQGIALSEQGNALMNLLL